MFNTHNMIVGDTLTPIGAQLVRGSTPADLTGVTVEFRMTDGAGTDKVEWTAAEIVEAESGTVKYDFQDEDVDEAGTYFGYWRIVDGAEYDTFPSDTNRLRIVIRDVI